MQGELDNLYGATKSDRQHIQISRHIGEDKNQKKTSIN